MSQLANSRRDARRRASGGKRVTHLGVGGTTGAAAVDAVVEVGELVRHSVGDVGPGRGARVGADDDAAIERDGHDGRLQVRSSAPVPGALRLIVQDARRD